MSTMLPVINTENTNKKKNPASRPSLTDSPLTDSGKLIVENCSGIVEISTSISQTPPSLNVKLASYNLGESGVLTALDLSLIHI